MNCMILRMVLSDLVLWQTCYMMLLFTFMNCSDVIVVRQLGSLLRKDSNMIEVLSVRIEEVGHSVTSR